MSWSLGEKREKRKRAFFLGFYLAPENAPDSMAKSNGFNSSTGQRISNAKIMGWFNSEPNAELKIDHSFWFIGKPNIQMNIDFLPNSAINIMHKRIKFFLLHRKHHKTIRECKFSATKYCFFSQSPWLVYSKKVDLKIKLPIYFHWNSNKYRECYNTVG